MDRINMIDQAWALYVRLLDIRDITTFDSLYQRYMQVGNRAFKRWARRQKDFIDNPGGFAPPPVQPSGAVGQGATL